MARIEETEGAGEIAERIRDRRPGRVLRPIDKVLLHSPRIADGWNSLLGAVRGGMTRRPDLREIVILRIAVLNDAAYEWDSHQADAAAAGLTAAQLAALREPDADQSAELDDLQRAVVTLTDELTRQATVSDEVFAQLESQLGVSTMVELTVTVAAYNMVSRLVVALGVESVLVDAR